jgi:Sulfotransferase family
MPRNLPGERIAHRVSRRPHSTGEPGPALATLPDLDRLLESRWEGLVIVDEPLVLVSQVQRSGGTLLNTLLDGHPELHVYPYELRGGHSTEDKARWPLVDLDRAPGVWLEAVGSPGLVDQFEEGYQKKFPATDGIEALPTLPFTIVPSLVEGLFRRLCAERPPDTQREVHDHYLTAVFNAWLDNQGLRTRPKRWVTGLTPRAAWAGSRERFFATYPDGRVIGCLRDPRAWWASASRFWSRYADFEATFPLWERGALELAAAKRERPGQVFVVTYEAVVHDPTRAMRALADWLGIAFDPILLCPTFNRLPTVPNSSFAMGGTGIRDESLERWRQVLDRREIAAIEDRALALDAEIRALADIG